ncbi:isochorismatase family protein [Kineosporia sp. J2-2]|uniref:Isochorismatase family protein n=1 Tax=Kineosporia corallincola TaxID=2835133 RepID=A0ABS5TG28_9ACTN|nr:isochorismatase family protein [Kineosporia corallincola]MBT0769033.1 isochorismatase family protein [Kineosporia corallincola]
MTTPRRALVVVDVQQEYFDGPLEIQYPPRDEALERILAVVATAREHGLPIAFAQHTAPADSPVFAAEGTGWQLHPRIAAAVGDAKVFRKEYGSIYAGTDLAAWLRARDVDTVTLTGFMTHNCDLASAVESEGLGFTAEILSDASGTTHLANDAGQVSAHDLHTTLMTLFNANFAAVASTGEWTTALAAGTALPQGNLVASAVSGRSKFA